MKAHEHTELFETQLSTNWFDDSGVLCGLSKKSDRTINHYYELIDLFKQLTKDRGRLCLLVDANNSSYMSEEIIKYTSVEYPKYLKAMAIVSTTTFENTQVNTFLKLTFANFPVMRFSNELEARAWLKDYL